MKQAEWRGMPFFDVFWRKRHMTRRQLQGIFASSYTYIFFFMVIAVLVLLDMHDFAARVSLVALITYTSTLSILTFLIYLYVTHIGLKLSKKYDWFFVVYPVVGFAAATLASLIVELGMSAAFGGQMSLAQFPEKLPMNLALTLVIETLFLTFVIPTVFVFDARKNKPAEPEVESTANTITAAGTRFYCDQLVLMSAQDHYVCVRTKDGETMIRARLSDLTEQLGEQRGIQPHRSHWVAREAAVAIEAQNGNKVLRLADESCVPIARGRVSDVKAWLENKG